ncbi:DUF3152 domain-containing protein [Streptomyces sp. URMC 123]|uniref:DUF3152 domain-containing protein n=1 Tax=Streptomyces sp. URMC 123 TaxID=3423403 RepID=UPI003F1C20AD
MAERGVRRAGSGSERRAERRGGRAGRRGRRGAAWPTLVCLAVAAAGIAALLGGAGLAHWQRLDDEADAVARARTEPLPGGSGAAAAAPPATSAARPSPGAPGDGGNASGAPPGPSNGASGPSGPSGSPSSSPSTSPSTGASGGVRASGPGTFATAQASGAAVGTGTIRRYQVQVEHGIELSAGAAANEIAGILGHSRGWTKDGVNGFELVSSGPTDFVVKIATPATVDRICGAAGLDTGGEVNCAVGATVVVNLKRWMLGSPEFDGPLGEYRALIVNHEVGHRIGHGHEGCAGPGKPAPAMMQQIKGLKGCTANAWPYDTAGKYIGGPRVP